MFVDRAEITIKSGKGGNGAVTFRRDPYVPDGGPDGGDGGDGGSVIFIADRSLRTLMDLKYKRKYQAENGQNGMKRNRFGKKGQDLYIKVPVGTMIIDKETGLLMKDLCNDGDTVVFLKTPTFYSGQDCCVRINGSDATFKRVTIKEDGIMLTPLNLDNSSRFLPKFYSKEEVETLPVEILGVAKKLVKYL